MMVEIMLYVPGGEPQRTWVPTPVADVSTEKVRMGPDLWIYFWRDAKARGEPHNRWGIHGAFAVVRVEGDREVSVTADDVRELEARVTEETDEHGIPVLA